MASGVAISVKGRRSPQGVAEAYWGCWWVQGVVGSLKEGLWVTLGGFKVAFRGSLQMPQT
jgi:hypothetical protein